MQKIGISMLLLLCLGSINPALSQIDCGTEEVMEDLHRNSLEFQVQQLLIEHFITDQQKYGLRSGNDPDTVHRLEVVIHIIHKTPEENFTDQQVLEQIESFNLDLRRLNTNQTNYWPQAADTKMEVRLATTDPAGNPTNGIERRQTYKGDFYSNDDMKRYDTGGLAPWPSDRYINIWVCNLNGKIGFATRPGTPPSQDGIVIDYRSFGINSQRAGANLGRTLTHEFGHYMGLYHTFHGGCTIGDRVEDTPPTAQANYGCQSNLASCGSPDMPENFMDLGHDACISLFTEGQKARMRASLLPGGPRHSLLGIPAPDTTVIEEPPIAKCQKPEDIVLTNQNKVLEVLWNPGEANSYLFEFKLSSSNRWMALPLKEPYLLIRGIDENWSYSVRVTNICEDGQKSESVEIMHGSTHSRIAAPAEVQTISIYDFSGKYHKDITPSQQFGTGLSDLGLANGLYLLVKRDAQGRHIKTEKVAIFH